MASMIPIQRIERGIVVIRGHRVMLSPDLAALYGVEPRALVQAVKRNIQRFPADFMFQLSAAEAKGLKSQIVISSWGGARRANPYAFTEQGVAMLSSVLRSERAVAVNRKSCARSSGCGNCWRPTPSWQSGSIAWSVSTIVNSPSCSMPSGR